MLFTNMFVVANYFISSAVWAHEARERLYLFKTRERLP